MTAESAASLVLRSDDPRCERLLRAGWRLRHRSWAAQLEAAAVDVERLTGLVAAVTGIVALRELRDADAEAVLRLDARTLADYPGGPATRPEPMDRGRARPSGVRRGFGAFDAAGALLGMSWCDIEGEAVETDVTVVEAALRGRGVGTALKAFSILALLRDGARRFRTGGAEENAAVLAANRRLGYAVDEWWWTLAASDSASVSEGSG